MTRHTVWLRAAGLEGRTPTRSLCQAQTRALACDAVLKEQLDQRKQGILDAYVIAPGCLLPKKLRLPKNELDRPNGVFFTRKS
jgi:hypothetical protein